MKTLRARLDNIEESLRGVPGGMDPGIDALAAIIKAQPDLARMIECALLGGDEEAVLMKSRGEVTPERAQRLIDAVAEQDEKARGTGRPIPSSGLMGGAAREAKKYMREHAALAVTAGGSP